LQGQLVAVHPAYDEAFDGFAPEEVRGNPKARQAWAVDQMMKAAKASANLGFSDHASFSGAFAWPYVYPWPQRPVKPPFYVPLPDRVSGTGGRMFRA
jgi:hypothetical protein